jgi:hypothetical protein
LLFEARKDGGPGAGVLGYRGQDLPVEDLPAELVGEPAAELLPSRAEFSRDGDPGALVEPGHRVGGRIEARAIQAVPELPDPPLSLEDLFDRRQSAHRGTLHTRFLPSWNRTHRPLSTRSAPRRRCHRLDRKWPEHSGLLFLAHKKWVAATLGFESGSCENLAISLFQGVLDEIGDKGIGERSNSGPPVQVYSMAHG